VNLKNISKVEARQYIIINIFLISLIQSCSNIVPKSQLVFKDCEIYWNNRLFNGEYELNKGEKYILSKVYNGKIQNEKTFSNNILLMEKIYEGCYFGIQKNYNSQGKQISEGSFQSNKRVGEWKYFTKDSVYSISY